MTQILLLTWLIGQEPIPQGFPRTDPIPRQYSDLGPQALFEKLREEGTFPLQGRPGKARLLQQNMDSDLDPEYIILLEGSLYQLAIVMKRIESKWWTLGSFLSKQRDDSGTFVSLKPLVWPGTHDLIVRAGGSQGTGVGSFTQTIYRILRGNLYPVFTAVEEEWDWTSTKSAKIGYPKLGTILVKTSSSCTAHQWSADRFSFLANPCQ